MQCSVACIQIEIPVHIIEPCARGLGVSETTRGLIFDSGVNPLGITRSTAGTSSDRRLPETAYMLVMHMQNHSAPYEAKQQTNCYRQCRRDTNCKARPVRLLATRKNAMATPYHINIKLYSPVHRASGAGMQAIQQVRGLSSCQATLLYLIFWLAACHSNLPSPKKRPTCSRNCPSPHCSSLLRWCAICRPEHRRQDDNDDMASLLVFLRTPAITRTRPDPSVSQRVYHPGVRGRSPRFG